MAEKKKAEVPPNAAILIVIFVLQIVALFFEALGSPFDVYELDANMFTDNNGCYSLWGRKQCGGKNPKTWHDARYKTCGVFEASMKAGASFTIVSLFATAMGAFTAIMAACKCLKSKVPVVLFLIFGIVATTVPWAVVAGLYHNPTCSFGRLKDQGKYGPGFPFFIVAWGLTVICFVLSLFA